MSVDWFKWRLILKPIVDLQVSKLAMLQMSTLMLLSALPTLLRQELCGQLTNWLGIRLLMTGQVLSSGDRFFVTFLP